MRDVRGVRSPASISGGEGLHPFQRVSPGSTTDTDGARSFLECVVPNSKEIGALSPETFLHGVDDHKAPNAVSVSMPFPDRAFKSCRKNQAAAPLRPPRPWREPLPSALHAKIATNATESRTHRSLLLRLTHPKPCPPPTPECTASGWFRETH